MEILPGAIVAKTIYEQVADLEAELASATRDQKETQRDLDALYEVARRMGGELNLVTSPQGAAFALSVPALPVIVALPRSVAA